MRFFFFILLLVWGSGALAQEVSALDTYIAKMMYREHLRQNNLNPTDEEIQKQINLIKENPKVSMEEIASKESTPKKIEFPKDMLPISVINQKKPKRLGNHPLNIDPNLF